MGFKYKNKRLTYTAKVRNITPIGRHPNFVKITEKTAKKLGNKKVI